VHHSYDPNAGVLHLGNGTKRSAQFEGWIIESVAGSRDPSNACTGVPLGWCEGRPATEVALYDIEGLTVGADGKVFFTDNDHGIVGEIDQQGLFHVIPTPTSTFSEIRDVAMDDLGAVYVARYWGNRITRLVPTAGGGWDTQDAFLTGVPHPTRLAIGPGGMLYLLTETLAGEGGAAVIRAYTPAGQVRTVAGGGAGVPDQCNLDIEDPPYPISLAAGLDVNESGQVIFTEFGTSRLYMVDPLGKTESFAGIGHQEACLPQHPLPVDGLDKDETLLIRPNGVIFGKGDDIYFVDCGLQMGGQDYCHVRRISRDEVVHNMAGRDEDVPPGWGAYDGLPATLFNFGDDYLRDIAAAPDGSFYASSGMSIYHIRRGRIAWHSDEDFYIPSPDGGEVYVFRGGKHMETRDALTERVIRTFTYDVDGSLQTITDDEGRTTTIQRDGVNLTVSTTGQAAVPLIVNGNDYLTSVSNPGGRTYSMTYHPNRPEPGLLATFTNPRSKTSQFTYYPDGRLESDTNAKQDTITLDRDELGPSKYKVTTTSPEGLVTEYDTEARASGVLCRTVTRPDGVVEQSWVSGEEEAISLSPTGLYTEYVPGPDPRWGAEAPVTQSQRMVVYVAGQEPVNPCDEEGLGGGGVPARIMELSSERLVELDEQGPDPTLVLSHIETTKVTDGLSPQRDYVSEYKRVDPAHDGAPSITATSPMQRQYVSVLIKEDCLDCDPKEKLLVGRMEAPAVQIYPELPQAQGLAPLTVERTYDPVTGLLSAITRRQSSSGDERVRTTSFDSKGRVIALQDRSDQRVTYGYDVRGFVESEKLQKWNAVDEQWDTVAELDLGHDDNGNLISVTRMHAEGAQQSVFHFLGFDDLDLLESYDPPDVPGATEDVVFSYDQDLRLTGIDYPGGKYVEVDYLPGSSQLEELRASNGEGGLVTVVPTYDSATGRVTQQSRGVATLTSNFDGPLSTGQQWDTPSIWSDYQLAYAAQSFTPESILFGGTRATFERDNDQLTSGVGIEYTGDGIDDASLIIVRNHVAGLVTHTEIGSVTTDTEYNDFGEVVYFAAAFDEVVFYSYDLQRGPNGRIEGKTELARPCLGGPPVAAEYVYLYDDLGRLTDVLVGGVPTEHFDYDMNGNRTSWNVDDQDRITTIPDLQYDARGDVIRRGSQHYTYDALGNLTKVIIDGAVPPQPALIRYEIDPQNRRVAKRAGAGEGALALVQGLIYLDQLRPVGELDETGEQKRHFIYATDSSIPDFFVNEITNGAEVYRIIADHLGSPRYAIKIGGTIDTAVGQCMTFLAFGEVVANQRAVGFDLLPFGFAGGIYDGDTRMVRFGARDYDPQLGRWTAKDPILLEGDAPNVYLYVLDDPINWLDPAGLTKGGKKRVGGSDDALQELIEAMRSGGKEAVDKVKRCYEELFRQGKIPKKRWEWIKAWAKLVKDGRITTGGALPCLDSISCTCLNRPEECLEVMDELD